MRHHKANVSLGRSIKNIYVCIYLKMWAKARSIQGKMQNAGAHLFATGKLSLVWEPNRPIPPTPNSQLPTPDPFLLDQPVSLVFWAPYMASVVSMCLNTHLFIQIWPEGVCGNRRKHQHQQSRAVGVAAGRTIKASCECFNLTGCRMWNILLLCTHFIC